MRSLVVAVAQVRCVPLDPEKNAVITVERIREAAARGAQLVVLPELVATGYEPAAPGLGSLAESVDQPGPCLTAWTAVAAELGVAVVAGFVEREGDRLYNSAAIIDIDGSVLAVYRKLHLFGGERDVFTPGDHGLPLVEVLGASVGIGVCYDLRFPEVLRILAVRGAELVVVPTAWVSGFDRRPPADGRIGQVDGALVQSNLNQLFLACADQVGSSGDTVFLGRSVITDPYGQAVVGPLSADDEDLVVVTLDLDQVEQARHRGPGIDPMANRRTDVYADLLGYREPTTEGGGE